jgi:tRNA G10  N-methylase Trm11
MKNVSSSKPKYVHPFPARMAPDIALNALHDLAPGATVLDPMTGSGTVLHQAALNGLVPIGFDLDPLAILMSKVGTRKANTKKYNQFYELIKNEVKKVKLSQIELPWIDNDQETFDFIKYWFAKKQIRDLRKLSFVLHKYKSKFKNCIEIDALRIALSRIIITKKVGASLAWDISHSRPHKVRDTNDFDVMSGFDNSVKVVQRYLEKQTTVRTKSKINLGDARNLASIKNNSIDKVITSPPYLNAIDYMRGHKFSLVWLGYSIPHLREIRSISIGAERKISAKVNPEFIDKIYSQILKGISLNGPQSSMIRRYINDSILLMSEISRVLKKNKSAILVVGNSNLKGHYIKNSEVFNHAGKLYGLNLTNSKKREIPLSKRYLPVPKNNSHALGKRMRHEVVMTFVNEGLV